MLIKFSYKKHKNLSFEEDETGGRALIFLMSRQRRTIWSQKVFRKSLLKFSFRFSKLKRRNFFPQKLLRLSQEKEL